MKCQLFELSTTTFSLRGMLRAARDRPLVSAPWSACLADNRRKIVRVGPKSRFCWIVENKSFSAVLDFCLRVITIKPFGKLLLDRRSVKLRCPYRPTTSELWLLLRYEGAVITRKALLNLVSITFAHNELMRGVFGMFVLFVATVFQAKWTPFMRSMHWMSALEVCIIALCVCCSGLARMSCGCCYSAAVFALHREPDFLYW
jgi:hypothetical protein